MLSQLGLDFAQQGRPVLWGSVEKKQLWAKMMQQSHKAGKLSSLKPAERDIVANSLQTLPIKFLNFKDINSIDRVSREYITV